MDAALLDRRIEERNRGDAREAAFCLAAGIPLALAGLAFFDLIFYSAYMLWIWPAIGFGRAFVAVNTLGVLAFAFDAWRRPDEDWVRARFYDTAGNPIDASRVGPAFTLLSFGMPLMTSLSDPRNVWAGIARAANVFANLVLSGPRMIRRGIVRFVLIRRRRRPAVVARALEFLGWLESRGEVAGETLQEQLRRKLEWISGAILAREVGLLGEVVRDGARRVRVSRTAT